MKIQTLPTSTLFITTYEMPQHLALVCAGLETQTLPPSEIFFCDDGSGAETKQVIEHFKTVSKAPVFHLWQKHDGFRKCEILNQALRRANGEVCLFLDGDCVPHRSFVEDHLRQTEPGSYLAGRRVEIGPKLLGHLTPERIRSGFFNYPRPAFLSSLFLRDSHYFNRSIRLPSSSLRSWLGMNRVADLKGCNYSVARKALEAINGFDENYQGYGREDTDIELRLQNLGLHIKSLKGLALQFHLWHPRREFTPKNDSQLEEVRSTGRIRCQKGLLNETPAS